METTIALLVATLLVIAAAAAFAPKLRIAAPLILVAAGIGVSLIPGAPAVVVDPHVILLGLLPPLLYASAASMPIMNLRRELTAVNGLSIALVVMTALALGAMFAWLLPDLGFVWGVALGAILSPTDAVATSIIRGTGVPGRVATLLDGEGLLNDATALIVLRTAIVATAAGFSFWSTLGSFLLSIAVATAVGWAVARLNLAIRGRVRDEAVNTVLSFTTPFVAAVPTELLHGSGLVAAVIAGFVTSVRAPRELPPGHRMSDMQNWATVELVLEGLIFLTMGLQLSTILQQLGTEPSGIRRGILLSVAALIATVAVRAAYVGPLLWRLQRRAERWQQTRQPRFVAMQNELDSGKVPDALVRRAGNGGVSERGVQRFVTRLRRGLADIDYLTRQPLGRAEAAVVVWAGMRGAVTVAAVQLLPEDTPHRPLLVFIAFAVATLSLALQGGTIGLLAARLFAHVDRDAVKREQDDEKKRIGVLLDGVAAGVPRSDGSADKDHRLAQLRSQRDALLDARDDGVFDAEALEHALFDVDVDELVLELRS